MDSWDYLQVQRKWQARWAERKPFEPSVRVEAKKFFFTVPYPYVSGLLHVGHGRTYTNGDVIARFKRMRGWNVLWPMAFHITGTPVLAISAKIAAGDGDALQMFREYVGIYEKDSAKLEEIVRSFSDPWKLVNYFSGKLVHDFTSMGYSLDLSRQFTTGDAEYNKLIEWQFHKYSEKGFLKQASYPILYCVNDRNAVGEDDIKDADTDPVEMQHFVTFKFKLEDSDSYIVTCTLRPDTAFGILNLYANPKAVYVKAEVQPSGGGWKENWVVSREAVEKLSTQGYALKVVGEVPGESLIAKYCAPAHVEQRVPIFPAEFVDANVASGIVHSSARSPIDYLTLQELKRDEKIQAKYPGLREQLAATVIPNIVDLPGFGPTAAKDVCERMKIANSREHEKIRKATIELYRLDHEQGVMTAINRQFSGMKVSEAKKAIADFLKQKGWSLDFYEVSRPAVCRCGGKVVGAVLQDQWFIDYKTPGWKENARQCLDSMLVYPGLYRKQFQDVFDWLDKRPCARRRGLGTKLPFAEGWIIESLSDSTIYMAFYAIIKNVRKLGLKPEQLSPEFFDFVFLGNGDAQQVADKIGSQKTFLEEIRGEFLYWYPNDLRHTGIAHITNHLSFFVFAHAALFPREHWPKGISLNEFILSEGSKMSKSKGNVVLLNSIAAEGMADVFRLYVTGAADFSSVLDYRKRDVEVARKSLGKFVSTIASLIELSRAVGGKSFSVDAAKPNAQLWFSSKFERAVKQATKAMEEFRLRDYVQVAFYSLLKDFDYFMRRASQEEKKAVADLVALRWIALLAPLVPHSCEELWERAGMNSFVSLAEWPESQESLIAPEIELREDLVNEVVSDARRISQMLSKSGKKFSKATVITASESKWRQLFEALRAENAEEAAGGALDEGMKQYLLKEFYALQYKLGGEAKQMDAGKQVDEFSVLGQAKQFVSSQLGMQLAVEREEESRSTKAGKAMPLKPAIVLE